MLKTRTWIIIIAAAALTLAVLSAYQFTAKREGNVVEVVQDGVVLREIDLSAVTREYSFVVESSGGGTGSNPSITLVKRDAESLSSTLSGATFQLFYMHY